MNSQVGQPFQNQQVVPQSQSYIQQPNQQAISYSQVQSGVPNYQPIIQNPSQGQNIEYQPRIQQQPPQHVQQTYQAPRPLQILGSSQQTP